MIGDVIKRMQHRIIKTTLPSDGRQVRVRPWQGREEKLLLIAKESRDSDEIMSTVSQVVQNCLIDEIDVSTLPIVDVEWLFIQTRIESVSPMAPVSYLDPEDGRRHEMSVDLRDVKVVKPSASQVIDMGDGVTVKLRWPTAQDFVHSAGIPSETESAHALAVRCVDVIYDGDQAIDAKSEPIEMIDELVSCMGVEQYKAVMDWVASTPYLSLTATYVNSRGTERKVHLRNLTDFFSFR